MRRLCFSNISFFVSLVFFLGGCGGGNGGQSTPSIVTSTDSFPIEATFVSLSSTSNVFSASGSDSSGNTYQVTYSISPAADKIVSQLSANPLKVYVSNTQVKKNGLTASVVSSENYFTLSPLILYGSYTSATNDWFQTKVYTVLPATAKVGSSGGFYSGSVYYNASKILPEPASATWSLEADTATTAWLCLNRSITNYVDTTSDSICFKIDKFGVISSFKLSTTNSGSTLILK